MSLVIRKSARFLPILIHCAVLIGTNRSQLCTKLLLAFLKVLPEKLARLHFLFKGYGVCNSCVLFCMELRNNTHIVRKCTQYKPIWFNLVRVARKCRRCFSGSCRQKWSHSSQTGRKRKPLMCLSQRHKLYFDTSYSFRVNRKTK